MSSMLPAELELLGRQWPEQIIDRYDDYFKIWRSSYKDRLAIGTERHYADFGSIWCAFANGKNLTPVLMLQWHDHVSRRQSTFRGKRHGRFVRVSVNRVMKFATMLKKFLGWLKAVGIIHHDPSMALPHLREEPRQPHKLYLHHEYLKILEYGSRTPKVEPLLFMVILGYHTGMGVHECCYLRWEEVVMRDDAPSYIQKQRSKLKSTQGVRALCTIPLIPGSELWLHMKRLEAMRPHQLKRSDGIEYVHPDLPPMYECVKPRLHVQLRRSLLWPALGGPAGLKDRTFRHFRNSFCSRLINAGVDSLLVSKMTGHTNLTQLSAYVMPNLRAMQDALLKAMRWAEGESGPDMPRQFLTLPSPSSVESATPSPGVATSLASAGERQ